MKIEIEAGVRLYVDIELNGVCGQKSINPELPTLLLLHGGPGSNHASFKPLFSKLSDIVQIVYYDHRSHGKSDDRPDDELTLDVFADDIVRLCDVLEIKKPIVLGQSFGGFVAQKYIARHPNHPSKVILSSTSPKFGLERKLKMFESLGGIEARKVAEEFWTNPNSDSYHEYKKVCKPFYSAANPTKIESDNVTHSKMNEIILFNWIRNEHKSMDLLQGLGLADCPVLVLAGDVDPVCPIWDSQDIIEALPQSLVQFEVFKNCAHGVWRDNPDRAFKSIRQFILS